MSKATSLYYRWTALIINQPLKIISCLILLSLFGLGLFLVEGRLNSDLGQLIEPGEDKTWYQANERYKQSFPMYLQTAILVVRGDDHALTQASTRAIIRALNDSQAFERIFAPGVDPFVQNNRLFFLTRDELALWLEGTEYNFGALVRMTEQMDLANALLIIADTMTSRSGLPLPVSVERLAEGLTTGEAKGQAFYPLVDPDQAHFFELILVNGKQDLQEALPNAQIVETLESILENTAIPSTVKVELTGEVVLAHEEIGAALSGIEIAGLVSILLLGLILTFGIGDFRVIMSIFALLATGIGLTLGFATLAVGSFNTLSMLFVVMFFGLGVDFAVHFALRLKAQGAITADSLQAAVEDMAPALILCTFTSAIAFLSFVPTAYTGMGELGLISAGGMVFALILTLFMIPTILHRWPARSNALPQFSLNRKLPYGFQSAATGLLIVILPLAVYFASQLKFDYSVLSMRDPDSKAMTALTRLQRDSQQTDYSVSVLADNAAEARRLKALLTPLTPVGDVRIPEDLIPTAQREKAAMIEPVARLYQELWDSEVIEDESIPLNLALEYLMESQPGMTSKQQARAAQIQQTAQYFEQNQDDLAHYNSGLGVQMADSLTELQALLEARPFTIEEIPTHFRERLISSTNAHLVTIQPAEALDSKQATDRFIHSIQTITPDIAGRSAVEWGIGDVVVEAFQVATLYTLVGVMICLLIYFRHLLTAVLVLIPIAFTLILTFAMCTLFDLPLNMANILVVPLIIGLGVDSGIHITHRFVSTGAKAFEPATRRAILISGLTTLGTFLSLVLSPHQGAASIGLILTIAIIWLLILSLFLLPTLLRLSSHYDLIPTNRIFSPANQE